MSNRVGGNSLNAAKKEKSRAFEKKNGAKKNLANCQIQAVKF